MTYYEPQDWVAGSGDDDDLQIDPVRMVMRRKAGRFVRIAEPVLGYALREESGCRPQNSYISWSHVCRNRSDDPGKWSLH